jgi:hypothetical protein
MNPQQLASILELPNKLLVTVKSHVLKMDGRRGDCRGFKNRGAAFKSKKSGGWNLTRNGKWLLIANVRLSRTRSYNNHMKNATPLLRLMSGTIFAALLGTGISTFAISDRETQSIVQEMRRAPAPEKPAKAASLVKKARKKDREAVATVVVRAAIEQHPGSAAMVVSEIIRVAPEVAPAAAAAAARQAPARAIAVAQAAVKVAPESSARIMSEVAKAAPQAVRENAVITPSSPAGQPPAGGRGSAHTGQPTSGGPAFINNTTINTTNRKNADGSPALTFGNTPPEKVTATTLPNNYARQF